MRLFKDFLEVFAVGGLLWGVVWLFARKRIQQSWRWRGPFCFLIAISITPTAIKIGESWSLIPAAFIALFAPFGDNGDMRYGLLFGLLPILAVASIIFVVWSIILRKLQHVA